MVGESDWIRAALARDKTKTQNGLAHALGIDKSSVSRLLRGARRLKFAEARLAAEFLGVEVPAGLAEEGEEFRRGVLTQYEKRDFAPLYRATAASDEFWRLDRKMIVERKPRAPLLLGVVSAYGFYAPDNVMAPRFKTGEVAWVNPARPGAPGDDALLVARKSAGGVEKILLCELIALTRSRIVIRQHSREEDREFDRKAWDAVYVFPRG